MGFELGEREDISDCLGNPPGSGAHLHRLTVKDTEYGVLFVPMGSWETDTAEQVSALIGRELPEGAYEIKFDLMQNMTGEQDDQYKTRSDLGLKPLRFQELMSLGRGILATMLMFRDDYEVSAFYAVAVDGNHKLCQYYSRLFGQHAQKLRDQELEPVASKEGLGYAFYCQRSGADGSAAAYEAGTPCASSPCLFGRA